MGAVAHAGHHEKSMDASNHKTSSTEQSASLKTPRKMAMSTPSKTDVRRVQAGLNRNGFKIAEDGIFGTNTRNALTEFQQQNNIAANGQINQETKQALGLTSGNSMDSTEQTRRPASVEESPTMDDEPTPMDTDTENMNPEEPESAY